MKIFSTLILFIVVSLTSVFAVNAQAAETIWIQSNTKAYKTKETVTVTINATSTTPIQGFNAQLQYDPSCLQPVNGISSSPGMNGLAVPQLLGLVDASFASTTPLLVNGTLAEVRFTALKGCQTSVNIETAALVVRNESGYAVPVAGINIDQSAIALTIDSAEGIPQPEVSGESVLPLAPTRSPASKPINWGGAIWLVMAGIPISFIVGFYKMLERIPY